ncbi:carbohydrate ABC transporter permease [Sporosarcina sp. Marseille-Q4063]|uniref:carbohydrate ABC transporter permease n=1 Tax=Sporosarcina sp. Marseille-Q4063 TaxID=2810514 RepID=UPI001BAE6077|nr:carbohydrate ABC transporter permease [Sporosarcina sp. Marseille-Q4063]QUW24057.1 carbohydrate ABC transporter permease [Sporosarcina sp. Marseille-Q4063]
MKKLIMHICLIAGVIISIFPFYWLIVLATNDAGASYKFPPIWSLGNQFITNVQKVFTEVNFLGSLMNTVFVSTISTVLVVFLSSLAGFVFAKFDFPGKNKLFVFTIATMMIPAQLSLIPMFIMMQELGWIDSYKALIIPGLVSAFGIFWVKQYAEGAIHDDLLNAARIDGCGIFRMYWSVALPVLKPAIAFLAIFNFMGVWNDYLWPLIVLNDPSKYTLMVELANLKGLNQTDTAAVMTGTLLGTLPLIILFLIVSRQFISDIAAGAVKD